MSSALVEIVRSTYSKSYSKLIEIEHTTTLTAPSKDRAPSALAYSVKATLIFSSRVAEHMMLSALVMQAQSTAPVFLLSRSLKIASASDSAVVDVVAVG